jgi:hypothetical protein
MGREKIYFVGTSDKGEFSQIRRKNKKHDHDGGYYADQPGSHNSHERDRSRSRTRLYNDRRSEGGRYRHEQEFNYGHHEKRRDNRFDDLPTPEEFARGDYKDPRPQRHSRPVDPRLERRDRDRSRGRSEAPRSPRRDQEQETYVSPPPFDNVQYAEDRILKRRKERELQRREEEDRRTRSEYDYEY